MDQISPIKNQDLANNDIPAPNVGKSPTLSPRDQKDDLEEVTPPSCASLPKDSDKNVDKEKSDFAKEMEDKQKMKNRRIIQRNVIYVIGIDSNIASKDILASEDFFGQYGEIINISMNKKSYVLTGEQKHYSSAYVTFSNKYSASLAIIALESCS